MTNELLIKRYEKMVETCRIRLEEAPNERTRTLYCAALDNLMKAIKAGN